AKRQTVVDQPSRDNARETRDRTHRKIDAPAENDKGHADAENRIDRHVLDQNRQITPGEKRRRGYGECDRQKHQHDYGAQPEQQHCRGESDVTGRRWRGMSFGLGWSHEWSDLRSTVVEAARARASSEASPNWNSAETYPRDMTTIRSATERISSS